MAGKKGARQDVPVSQSAGSLRGQRATPGRAVPRASAADKRTIYDTSPGKCLPCGGYKEQDPGTFRWVIRHRPGCVVQGDAAGAAGSPVGSSGTSPGYCRSCDTYARDDGRIEHHPRCQEHPSNLHKTGFRAEELPPREPRRTGWV